MFTFFNSTKIRNFSAPSALARVLQAHNHETVILRKLSYWVTVYAATLIFISVHGSAISSAQEGRSGNIYIEDLM